MTDLTMEEEACPPTDEDGNTKKVRLKAIVAREDPSPKASHVEMEELRVSYKDKLSLGKAAVDMEDPWALDEEPVCEEGDITVIEDADGENVVLSDDFKRRLEKPWEKAIIVKLLGREIGYRALQIKIQAMWKPTGPFCIIDLEGNFYIIRFWDNFDYLHALTGGPWAIYGHALCVQPWCQNFRADSGSVDKAVIWVKFPGIPVDRYHTKVLRTLGNRVGSTVRIDIKTESQTRAKFAKVAVAVDLTKPLKGKVKLDGELYKVVYEGLPQICFSCGRYGHSEAFCSFHNPVVNPPASGSIMGSSPETSKSALGSPANASSQGASQSKGKDVGDWMVVAKRSRKPARKQQESPASAQKPTSTGSTGNRFHSLEAVPDFCLREPAPTRPSPPPIAGQASTSKAQPKGTLSSSSPKTSSTNRKSQPSKILNNQPKPYARMTPLKEISNQQTLSPKPQPKQSPITTTSTTPPQTQPKILLRSNPLSNPEPRQLHSAISLEESCHKIIYSKDHIIINPPNHP
ncbi:hypothetical protein Tsubulata_006170 [Turnera subulata]|uniref:CCHC-type domain-containing protein n=1 Tax=Turnera subulata TaxID=218843 RepID=A0A9Q0JC78_9ROSI|nr:hypothetical protein Tsubulata_006170 [Turnera subulata]